MSKIHLANAILEMVKYVAEEFDFDVSMYCNGREQGYCLTNHENGMAVAFSENRNSDDIVLYKGECKDFNLQGNVPTDAIYRNAEYYSYTKVEPVATNIVLFLRG